jgi:hypothetical protein
MGFYVCAVLALYLFVSFMGVTTSNVSAVWGTEEERAQVLIGEFRQTRSDEYLRGTPRLLADLRGMARSHYTPLDVTGTRAYQERQQGLGELLISYSRPLHQVLIDVVARQIPLRMGFALVWWMSCLTLFIFLPLWFKRVGLSGRMGVLASIAIFGCSLNAWFSYLPSSLVGNAAMAAVCGLWSIDFLSKNGQRPGRFLIGVVLAIYCGRSAFAVAEYPPWGFPILICIGGVSLLVLWTENRGKNSSRQLILTTSIALASIVLTFIHNRMIYSVVLDTVYPGGRRTTSGDPASFMWSGALSWFMQGNFSRIRGMTNPEMALGPTFLLVPLGFLVLLEHGQFEDTRHVRGSSRRYGTIILGTCAVLMLWATVSWPDAPGLLNPLELIPTIRATQIVSVLALLAFFVIYRNGNSQIVTNPKWMAFGVAFLTIVITSPDIERFRIQYLAGSGRHVGWISLFIVAFLSTLVVIHSQRWKVPILVALLSLASSVTVNPWTLGVGAFEGSAAVDRIIELSKENPSKRWATTGFFQDALMISTGVAQLSGQQPLGPNSDAWLKLDPTASSKDKWNRGQSYVNFQWDGRPGITIWNPSPDVIQIVVNPCRPELDDLDLGWVVTAEEISFDCLRKEATVTWMGAPLNIYQRSVVVLFED